MRDLCSFELPPLADDCMLLLWRVASMQDEALRLADAWRFVVKAEIVWCKLTRTGKPHFGMGRYTRASHETCLVATRGRVQVADRSVRSVFSAPVQEHSRKPDAIYEIAERLVPLVPGVPHVELFARRSRPGWLSIGNQVDAANDNAREVTL
jgi:N6-adenosine-specific RNA methylase IME4